MPRFAVDTGPDLKSLGFYMNRGSPRLMRSPHAHTDIEGNFLLCGSLTYLHGGRPCTLVPGRFTLFWAGIPHRLVQVKHHTRIIWLVLPLAWYMHLQLPGTLTQMLLRGEMISAGTSDMDELLLSRWTSDLAAGDTEVRRIVMLEIEARLRRLAHAVAGGSSAQSPPDDDAGAHPQRLAAYMAQHYREPLTVRRITDSSGLHPNYAMQLFKKRSGMGLWEYLTRLRISHAQRLLLTTDWKVHRIALESGFAAPSRFYAAFSRISGCTPRAYRHKAVASAEAKS